MASGLRSEFFQRHENRELFNRLLNLSTEFDKVETAKRIIDDGDDEVSRQFAMLSEKNMVQSDIGRRQADMLETVSRLEERSLKTLKTEESKRFAESPPDWEADENENVLQLNHQIKQNVSLRRGRA